MKGTTICFLVAGFACASIVVADNPCRLVQDDVFINDPSACPAFFACKNGTAHPGNCPGNLWFDKKRGQCDYQENVKCDLVKQNVCEGEEDGAFIDDPQSCYHYFYCEHGVAKSYRCPNGLHFDPETKRCIYVEKSNCKEKEPELKDLICKNIPNNIKLTDETDCNLYFICQEEVGVTTKCPDDYYFDQSRGVCDLKDNVNCNVVKPPPNACQGKADGVFVKDPQKCNGFYQCKDQKIFRQGKCPKDLWFVYVSDTVQKCEVPEKVSEKDCENRCEGTESGFVVKPGTGCKSYYDCDQEKIFDSYECPNGFLFNVEKQLCDYPSAVDAKSCKSKANSLFYMLF